MSIYSGFGTRKQEYDYNICIDEILYLLAVHTAKNLLGESIDELKFSKEFKRLFRILQKMEEHKYLNPKFTETLKPLIIVLQMKQKNKEDEKPDDEKQKQSIKHGNRLSDKDGQMSNKPQSRQQTSRINKDSTISTDQTIEIIQSQRQDIKTLIQQQQQQQQQKQQQSQKLKQQEVQQKEAKISKKTDTVFSIKEKTLYNMNLLDTEFNLDNGMNQSSACSQQFSKQKHSVSINEDNIYTTSAVMNRNDNNNKCQNNKNNNYIDSSMNDKIQESPIRSSNSSGSDTQKRKSQFVEQRNAMIKKVKVIPSTILKKQMKQKAQQLLNGDDSQESNIISFDQNKKYTSISPSKSTRFEKDISPQSQQKSSSDLSEYNINFQSLHRGEVQSNNSCNNNLRTKRRRIKSNNSSSTLTANSINNLSPPQRYLNRTGLLLPIDFTKKVQVSQRATLSPVHQIKQHNS